MSFIDDLLEATREKQLLVAFLIGGLLIALPLYLKSNNYRGPHPPGPRGLPLLGNALQLPMAHVGTYLHRLHSQYGGFVYLSAAGTHMFSISDIELAIELFERRSGIYSSRGTVAYKDRYIDPEGLLWSLSKQGEHHYWGRKLSATVMKAVKAGHTEPLQYMEALATAQTFLDDGGCSWFNQMNRMSAGMTVAAMLGVRSPDGDTPEATKVLELVHNAVDVVHPLKSIINIFPFIDDIIPASVPTPWRSAAKQWVQHDQEGWNALLDDAVDGKSATVNTWASVFAKEKTVDGDKRYLVSQFGIAAIETTATALHSFVFACLAYPEWIKSAQEELDRVVGTDRLPTFNDRAVLPFIEAVVREVLRWNPPIRTGIPHENTADDVVEYKGVKYFIPKGSTIFAPAFAIEHDQQRYQDPNVFRPQRFLDAAGNLLANYHTSTFGFGRRLCVGVAFAERTLWINIAVILWTFNIRKGIDPKTGTPMSYEYDDKLFDGGLSNGPLPFPAIFEPRDENRVVAARRDWDACEKDLNALLAE